MDSHIRVKWGAMLFIAGAVLIASAFAASTAFCVSSWKNEPPLTYIRTGLLSELLDYLPFWHEERLRKEAAEAWTQSDWASSIILLAELRAIDPDDETVSAQLGDAHFLYGQQLLQADEFRAALLQFEVARIILPHRPDIAQAYYLLSEYQAGQDSCQREDWESAIHHLRPVYDQDSRFKDVTRTLWAAYYRSGLELQNTGALVRAKIRYESALKLFAGDMLMMTRLAEINRQLIPPDRRIVVNISKQRMYLYENGQLVQTWVCSTGEPGRDTKPGHYKVQTKMPVAYASAWNLDMPYWLGIYYAGSTENGIHAPPIQRSTGQKMWEGLLGYRVSYGCVILSDENARALYKWAPYGAPVDVVR